MSLQPAGQQPLPLLGGPTAERVELLLRESKAVETRRAYRADWTAWQHWCDRTGNVARPADPQSLAVYLAEMSGMLDVHGRPVYAPSTLTRWVAGINHAHVAAGFDPPGSAPVVSAALAGIRRQAQRPTRRARALTLDLLRPVVAAVDLRTWPAAVIGHRDRLVLLLGFTTAMRRSELAGLRVGDVTDAGGEGLRVRLRRSKTDQDGEGAWRPVPAAGAPADCAVCAWVSWRRLCSAAGSRIEVMRLVLDFDPARHACRGYREPALTGSGPRTADLPDPEAVAGGPLLRTCRCDGVIHDAPMSGSAINAAVKRRVHAAGLDASEFGAHSLRAGFVTQALRGGADYAEVMRQTGHTSPAMVGVYARETDPLRGNAVTKLGL